MDKQLLEILCCPVTKQPVSLLGRAELERVNARIAQGAVHYVDDTPVEAPLEEALITENRTRIYRVDDGIPIMLEERAISVEEALKAERPEAP